VKIHYRWHPYFGRTLPVTRRVSRNGCDYVNCELPDGTVGAVPTWMTDPEVCSLHTLGPGQVTLEALTELRNLIDISSSENVLSSALEGPKTEDGSIAVTLKEGE
jgi:hypothetical protein